MSLFEHVKKKVTKSISNLLTHSIVSDQEALLSVIEGRKALLSEARYSTLFNHLKSSPHCSDMQLKFSDLGPIFHSETFSDTDQLRLIESCRSLKPWRKGPFQINNDVIDSEWQCQMKWARLCLYLPDLTGKRVLDLGCGNGYFLWRLLELNPGFVLGLDPTIPFYLQFQLFNQYFTFDHLDFLPFGWEELVHFESNFDCILCMGVLYHHRDPISLLKLLASKLDSNGTLFLETLIHPSDYSYCLVPEKTYAGMRNVFHLPSKRQLYEWCSEAGFQEVVFLDETETSTLEQRSTEWSSPVSLVDQLDKDDNRLSKEGYPRPLRSIVKLNLS